MKKLIILICMAALLQVSACGQASPQPTATAAPTSELTAEPTAEPTPALEAVKVTESPDGEEFRQSIDLADYDNDNFDVTAENGVATVTISFAELWTDFADPDSENEAERAEAQHRAQISEAISTPRQIPAGAAVTAVYELPCTTWFPGSDAACIIGTEDGRWYHVELCGEQSEGVPYLTELTELESADISGFSWRSTSYTDANNVLYCGEDYVVALYADGNEALVWPRG